MWSLDGINEINKTCLASKWRPVCGVPISPWDGASTLATCDTCWDDTDFKEESFSWEKNPELSFRTGVTSCDFGCYNMVAPYFGLPSFIDVCLFCGVYILPKWGIFWSFPLNSEGGLHEAKLWTEGMVLFKLQDGGSEQVLMKYWFPWE